MSWLHNITQGVSFALPSLSVFRLSPDPHPPTLPPPPYEGSPTWRSPFPVSDTLFNATFDRMVPITFATVYFTAVTIFNQINRRSGFRAWDISKTSTFFYFKIFHNVSLSLYSLVTFIALSRALHVSLPGIREHGLAGYVDTLCKINGPRGFGDAVYYNVTTQNWTPTNHKTRLLGSKPDPTDVGRIWNEGLAFWGWLFYLSKFYEVVDTALIILTGKRSSTLQTYHHAGAMFAMWAGMRYMCPPIWMFVLVNSMIHALMYSYYTITTLGIKVPISFKSTLTTLQIAQFVIGASYAWLHFFIAYKVPVSVSLSARNAISALSSTASSAAAHASPTLSSIATAGTSFSVPPWLTKLLLRAGGSEALAQNVLDEHGQLFGAEHRPHGSFLSQITRFGYSGYRRQEQWVYCIDTTGQSFAIWLNVLYLMPLTVLFLRFFVRSYVLGDAGAGARKRKRSIEYSVQEAMRKTSDTLETLGETAERNTGPMTDELVRNAEDIRRDLQTSSGGNEHARTAEDIRRDLERIKDETKEVLSQNGDTKTTEVAVEEEETEEKTTEVAVEEEEAEEKPMTYADGVKEEPSEPTAEQESEKSVKSDESIRSVESTPSVDRTSTGETSTNGDATAQVNELEHTPSGRRRKRDKVKGKFW